MGALLRQPPPQSKDLGEEIRLAEVVDAEQLPGRAQAMILGPRSTTFVGCIVLIHPQTERAKIGFPCLGSLQTHDLSRGLHLEPLQRP